MPAFPLRKDTSFGTISMSSPADRVYSQTHEWHKVEGDVVTLGLTRFAVDALTDVTYVQMKPPGTTVARGDIIGEVESVKTTSDVYTLVGGRIVAVNALLAENPGEVNADPFGTGWLCKIQVTDASGLSEAKSAADYDADHPTQG